MSHIIGVREAGDSQKGVLEAKSLGNPALDVRGFNFVVGLLHKLKNDSHWSLAVLIDDQR